MPRLNKQLAFYTGTYRHVVGYIEKKIHTKNGLIVLPCSLNDFAAMDADPSLQALYRQIDICTTDGMPLVWWARWKTGRKTERVYGPDLMKTLIQKTQGKKYQHIFFGTTQKTLDKLSENIAHFAPKLHLTAAIAPPFRKITNAEMRRYAKVISHKPQPIIWIGLSSPKQITIALQWKKYIPRAAIFCVGAAFDFLAGQTIQAPSWIQSFGLEWLFRLCAEPKRLWRRYLVTIPLYLVRVLLGVVLGK